MESQGEVVIAHDNLTTLKVVSCRVTRLAVRCKNLTGLSLKNTALSALLPSCPKLTCLDLKVALPPLCSLANSSIEISQCPPSLTAPVEGLDRKLLCFMEPPAPPPARTIGPDPVLGLLQACSKIRDTELRSALIRLPKLTHLDLTANLPLSDDTLREVASTCTKITHLSLSNCIAVSLNSVRGFGALRHLNLSSCDSLTAATTLPVLESFTALEEIIMDGCSLLTQV